MTEHKRDEANLKELNQKAQELAKKLVALRDYANEADTYASFLDEGSMARDEGTDKDARESNNYLDEKLGQAFRLELYLRQNYMAAKASLLFLEVQLFGEIR